MKYHWNLCWKLIKNNRIEVESEIEVLKNKNVYRLNVNVNHGILVSDRRNIL